MENFTINRDKKTFVFDDGEEIPIPKEDIAEVLKSPYARKLEREEKEKLDRMSKASFIPEVGAGIESAKESFLGAPGETLLNYAKSAYRGLTPGEGQENLSLFERINEDFHAAQNAKKRHLADLSEEYPTSTAIGSGVGMAGELAALHNVSGKIAFPIMGAAHSDTSILEPGKKAEEAAVDFAVGGLLDKAFGGLSKIAAYRKGSRESEELAKLATEANAAETERAAAATKADAERFAKETAAQKNLMDISKIQEAENQNFLADSSKQTERIAKTMGSIPVDASAIGVDEFIENNITRSDRALNDKAIDAGKFLKSIFKPNVEGKISSTEFRKGMNALDSAIVRNQGIMKDVLSEFKTGVLERFPERMSESFIQEKWVPKILSGLKRSENSFIRSLETGSAKSEVTRNALKETIEKNPGISISQVNEVLKSLTKKNGSLQAVFSSDNFVNDFISELKESNQYKDFIKRYDSYFQKKLPKSFGRRSGESLEGVFEEGIVDEYADLLARETEKQGKKYLSDISNDLLTKQEVAARSAAKTPIAPPIINPPTLPPIKPAQTIKPDLVPIPTMPKPHGIYENLASGLEAISRKSPTELLKSRGLRHGVGLGALAKIAGVPLGTASTALIGGSGVLAPLTSPGKIGAALRMGTESIARGGFDAVQQRAEKYSSYHDGILDNPQERRSLVREVEDDQTIPLEQKALIQSKINRGKPIDSRVQ